MMFDHVFECRFNAKTMLDRLRNRRLVFVGDSIGRNQWESLLCLLSTAVTNKSSIYEVNGRPINKHTGFLVFKFVDFNCTIEYYRAPYLVAQGRPPAGSPKHVRYTLKLDRMDWSSGKWKGADVLVFNNGHWWNPEKTTNMGCYFQESEDVKLNMSIETAYQKSVETVLNWISKQVDTNKTQVIFRSFSPVHFRYTFGLISSKGGKIGGSDVLGNRSKRVGLTQNTFFSKFLKFCK